MLAQAVAVAMMATTVWMPPVAGPSCEPLSNHGTCYRPGETCRDRDYGVVGVDLHGNAIKCVDNDGWRWEG